MNQHFQKYYLELNYVKIFVIQQINQTGNNFSILIKFMIIKNKLSF